MSQNTTVPNNMVLAILSTLFCCLPIGIVAIIQASKVNGFVAQGNFAAAQDASGKAKKFAIIAVIAWVIMVILSTIITVVMIALNPNMLK